MHSNVLKMLIDMQIKNKKTQNIPRNSMDISEKDMLEQTSTEVYRVIL